MGVLLRVIEIFMGICPNSVHVRQYYASGLCYHISTFLLSIYICVQLALYYHIFLPYIMYLYYVSFIFLGLAEIARPLGLDHFF